MTTQLSVVGQDGGSQVGLAMVNHSSGCPTYFIPYQKNSHCERDHRRDLIKPKLAIAAHPSLIMPENDSISSAATIRIQAVIRMKQRRRKFLNRSILLPTNHHESKTHRFVTESCRENTSFLCSSDYVVSRGNEPLPPPKIQLQCSELTMADFVNTRSMTTQEEDLSPPLKTRMHWQCSEMTMSDWENEGNEFPSSVPNAVLRHDCTETVRDKCIELSSSHRWTSAMSKKERDNCNVPPRRKYLLDETSDDDELFPKIKETTGCGIMSGNHREIIVDEVFLRSCPRECQEFRISPTTNTTRSVSSNGSLKSLLYSSPPSPIETHNVSAGAKTRDSPIQIPQRSITPTPSIPDNDTSLLPMEGYDSDREEENGEALISLTCQDDRWNLHGNSNGHSSSTTLKFPNLHQSSNSRDFFLKKPQRKQSW